MLTRPPVPYAFAKANGVVVTGLGDGAADAVVRHGASAGALAELRRALGVPLRAQRVSAGEFDELVATLYNGAGTGAAALADDLAQDLDLSRLLQEIPRVEDLLDSQNDAPLIRLINALLTQALREGASDIHIEPFESRSVVRLRIDGTLRDLIEPRARPARRHRVAREDHGAARHRGETPAAGRPHRAARRRASRSTCACRRFRPDTASAWCCACWTSRPGDSTSSRLGMDDATLAQMDALIREPHGIVLMTGPTGSGKTTTLYAALSRLDPKALNIMTVEDPIEYDLDGISQTQINSRIDMSFARALRTILRQDPDVIMIGEIRDLETAQIAVQASLTGHLVFATLHTNDAVSAVTRLIDMGIEPFLLASSLIGIGAQRLVRRLCLECRRPLATDAVPLRSLGLAAPGGQFHAPHGCPACNRSGYKGRTGIYELLTVDDGLRKLIHDRASEQTLREYASAHGMGSLRDDGMRLAAEGTVSLEEVLRVTRER